MFLFGIGVFFAGLLLFQLINANWEPAVFTAFLDASTILAFAVAVTAVIIITGNAGVFASAVKSLFSKKHTLSDVELHNAIDLFKLLRRTVVCAAVLFVSVSVIIMMGSLFDTDAALANLALTLLIVFYAAIINLIFINPVITILQKRHHNEGL